MTCSEVICFLLGSMVMCAFCLVMAWRQERMDERLVRHIRRQAYLQGWQHGRDAFFAEPTLSHAPEMAGNAGTCTQTGAESKERRA